MQVLSRIALSTFRGWLRVRDKAFSVLISGAFAEFGANSVVSLPLRLKGERHIAIGDGVFVGSNSWLQAEAADGGSEILLSIGNGTRIAGHCVLSAVQGVHLEEDVLLARNVYISDHIHRYTLTTLPIHAQGLDKIRPTIIKRGAWIGQNVVICPGVTVGAGAVIGANSVVTTDIPEYSVAAGAPAQVRKSFAQAAG